jgi:hypothetical protein
MAIILSGLVSFAYCRSGELDTRTIERRCWYPSNRQNYGLVISEVGPGARGPELLAHDGWKYTVPVIVESSPGL